MNYLPKPKPQYWDNAPFVNNTQPYTNHTMSRIWIPQNIPQNPPHISPASSVLGAILDGTSGSGGAMYLSPHAPVGGCCRIGVEAVFWDFQ